MTEASGSRKEKSTRKAASERKPASARKSTPKSAADPKRSSKPKSSGTRKKTSTTAAGNKRVSSAKPKTKSKSGNEPRKMPRRTPELTTNASGSRHVQCYHCRERFEVSIIAESTTCPGCNQRVIVGDVIVDTLRPVRAVQTCGRIVVKEKARVNAQIVEAHEGLEMLGGLSGNVVSGGPVIIGPKAQWAGDCRAPSLEIRPGARIESGSFIIPDDSLGLADLPGRDDPEQRNSRRSSRR
jgi:hypothetical protein